MQLRKPASSAFFALTVVLRKRPHTAAATTTIAIAPAVAAVCRALEEGNKS